MAGFLLFMTLVCVVVGLVAFFKQAHGWYISAMLIGVICFFSFAAGGSYLAGKGDAERYAKEWVDKWMQGEIPNEIDCQARDTDDNGYVTCTVGVPGSMEGPTAIECGVNRWYHGYNVTGCRLMKGYSGRQ